MQGDFSWKKWGYGKVGNNVIKDSFREITKGYDNDCVKNDKKYANNNKKSSIFANRKHRQTNYKNSAILEKIQEIKLL